SSLRRSCLRSAALPRSFTPCTCKTIFAKSIPTVVICMVTPPLRSGNGLHLHFGTSMPLEEGGVHPITTPSPRHPSQPARLTGAAPGIRRCRHKFHVVSRGDDSASGRSRRKRVARARRLVG